MKISVIIPVYQAQKFLPACLESIRTQSLRDFEVICVDDGSTDLSRKILHSYSTLDSRFHVIYNSHSGVSHARNTGILHAKGEYLCFVDSDDLLKQNTLKQLYQVAKQKNCDIVVFGGKSDLSFRTPEWIQVGLSPKTTFYSHFNPTYLFKEPGCIPFSCNKLFKRSFLEKTKVFFPEDLSLAEDLTFLFLVLPLAKRVQFISKRYYFYRLIQEGSAVAYSNENLEYKYQQHFKAVRKILEGWKRMGLLQRASKEMTEWVLDFLFPPMLEKGDKKKEYGRELIEIVEKITIEKKRLGKKWKVEYEYLESIKGEKKDRKRLERELEEIYHPKGIKKILHKIETAREYRKNYGFFLLVRHLISNIVRKDI